ncbi:helix-turn-helix transcriptional regulator [Flagellimonas meridianipacifica]|uniref:Putative DNA-binding transcriptional regulator AlpA n=1 Tax=Flagellimonas meridianipacifica TaxID=1080225 RepID=A0A2T0MFK8_9FLAO|nr:helix-turn-helix domain-containing protein [Allomuricauda pacifica]PRX56367.1 putative DNA-binding transcriptional regulator AlpA [Allomuricauda pacifica]
MDKLNYHLQQLANELGEHLKSQIKKCLSEEIGELSLQDSDKTKLLTSEEVCEKLGFSKSHLYNLRKRHKDFPVYRLDKCIRFRIDEIEQFIKNLNQGK